MTVVNTLVQRRGGGGVPFSLESTPLYLLMDAELPPRTCHKEPARYQGSTDADRLPQVATHRQDISYLDYSVITERRNYLAEGGCESDGIVCCNNNNLVFPVRPGSLVILLSCLSTDCQFNFPTGSGATKPDVVMTQS